MIVLDTPIWIWWVSGSNRLSDNQREVIQTAGRGNIGVSAISCWEVAKLVELGRLELDRPVVDWLRSALLDYRIRLLELSPEVAVASTQLPGSFHRDPADQIIVATARLNNYRLVTSDGQIAGYVHVETVA